MNNSTQSNKSVIIVGTGISGCQAALNLADLGVKVYLIEEYLTNEEKKYDKESSELIDCSSCLKIPIIMGIKDHPNIELIEDAEVIQLNGSPGNFKAVILHKKSGDLEELRKTPCEECHFASSIEGISDLKTCQEYLKSFYTQSPEVVALKILLEKRRIPPCEAECPAHVKAQEYNSLISKEEYKEAIKIIRNRCPLPASIGRICHHPCEIVCNRKDVDEPINICGLKRFVADYVAEHLEDTPEYLEDKKDKKIAVIGSGPSGLTVAFQLARRGYGVTIFEKEAVPGGMLRLGVPSYRLPPQFLDKDIEYIQKYGVEIKTETPIGTPGLTIKDLLQEYNAVYIGVGLQQSRKLNIEGEELENIEYAIEFLKKCKFKQKINIGKKVLIIGGGDVAIDVARSALRKGAKEVRMVMLESEDIIPAKPWEVQEAKEEGIIFTVSRGPKRFIGKDGKVTGLETLICSSVFDENGRFNPVFEACTEEIFEADMIIVSVGQMADLEFIDKSIKIERGIVVNPNTFQTTMEGVFAGGEVVTGPGSAINAIATGNKAAIVIERYLKGEDISKITETIPDYQENEIIKLDQIPGFDRIEKDSRREIELIPPKERKHNFKEITIGLNVDTAIEEANRCLSCGVCKECLENVKKCVARSIDHKTGKNVSYLDIDGVILSSGESWLFCYDLRRNTDYRWRIINPIAVIEESKCIGCGDCTDACLFDAIERIKTLIEYNSVRDSIIPSLSLIRYKSKVKSEFCKGCGACIEVCPVGAINFQYFTTKDLSKILFSNTL
ncbi:MAG: FAD-dependent oxidoreductase [Promethearchaeota archaeon]